MKRSEILEELKALHDAMVFGKKIIPGRRMIQAVYEAAEMIEAEQELDVIAEV